MQTNTQDWRVLMNEAAYSLIREQAPAELPLYVKTRDRFFADPAGFTTQVSAVDRPLGMGAIEAVQMFSEAVFPLLGPILSVLGAGVAAAVQDQAKDRVVAEVRKIFTKPEPLFTQAQLEAVATEISAVVNAQQQQHNLDPAHAEAIKDAVIARLALAKKS